ncbi:MAG: FHA domain-containing protein [Anaerolineales bacterium]
MTPSVLMLIFRVLMALTLYAFLALILVALWRDLRSVTDRGANVPETYLIEEEPSGDSLNIRIGALNLIGRAVDCTIRLTDETVSAHHARLSYQGNQWWLEDLGSKNGTMVNDFSIEGPTIITDGDCISLGQVDVMLHSGSQEKSQDTRTNA